MANRLTLMDGDLVEYQPTSVRTRLGRFPVRTSLSKKLPKAEQQHATPVPTSASHIDESAKPKYATPVHISADDERARPELPRKEKFLKCLTDQSDGSYYDFMPLDQAGPAVIACDNKDRSFVAIKRAKKSSIDDVFRIPDFVSDHVVNIKDMFLDKEEVVIVYEQMDVSLRHIMAVAGGPLQAFEIAAVCKEVSLPLGNILGADSGPGSWLEDLPISTGNSQCIMGVYPVLLFSFVKMGKSRSVSYARDRLCVKGLTRPQPISQIRFSKRGLFRLPWPI